METSGPYQNFLLSSGESPIVAVTRQDARGLERGIIALATRLAESSTLSLKKIKLDALGHGEYVWNLVINNHGARKLKLQGASGRMANGLEVVLL